MSSPINISNFKYVQDGNDTFGGPNNARSNFGPPWKLVQSQIIGEFYCLGEFSPTFLENKFPRTPILFVILYHDLYINVQWVLYPI